MSLDTAQSVSDPRGNHQLDAQKLLSYLRGALPDLATFSGPLKVQQFQHGQSNPTFLLESFGHPRRMVLRKQPPGRLLASAHAVDREYRVLRALEHTAVPVPRPLLLCQDVSVLGTQFYVMEFAAGRIYTDPNLPEMTAGDRANTYHGLARTLAELHRLSPSLLDLHGFGNPVHYCRRQVDRWSRQYLASVDEQQRTGNMHQQVLQLISWLRDHVPAEDASPAVAAVVHGDYRLDNLVLDPQLKVTAVLDWELATLGNAWADVSYMCLGYHLPPELASMSLKHPLQPGIPSEQELLQAYCSALGRDPPTPQDWSFYIALSLFRLLAILAGVQARSRQGNASSAFAAAISSDNVLAALASTALSTAGASSAHTDSTSSNESKASAGKWPSNITSNFNCGTHSSTSTSTNSSILNRSKAHTSTVSPAAANTAGSDKNSAKSSLGRTGPSRAAGLGGPSGKAQQLLEILQVFMEQHIYPAEHILEEHAAGNSRWTIHPLVDELKMKAKAAGLWNLWMAQGMASQLQHLLPLVPEAERSTLLGAGLSHLDYAHLCGLMGSSLWAPELFNCSAPDTGNMEVLAKYGTPEQQERWLLPLLRGHIRSCFAMTEKLVASSDATNITAAIQRTQSGGYRVQGHKWWTSGALDPRCKVAIFMGKTDPTAATHRQQSMIIVPMDAPGVKVIRPMLVFGYDDAPHGHAEVLFDGVEVPASNLLLGEGRGFDIAQGRLGPGRLHHCMRLIGAAERALSLAATRSLERVAFGKPLAAQGALREVLARQRVALEGARLLVLNASHALDRVGHKRARGEIAAAKVAAPAVALQVMDAAIQIHGGAGVSQDTVLAHLYAAARTLRIADGPDEVHLGTLAKLELEAAAGGPQQLKKQLAAGTRPKL